MKDMTLITVKDLLLFTLLIQFLLILVLINYCFKLNSDIKLGHVKVNKDSYYCEKWNFEKRKQSMHERSKIEFISKQYEIFLNSIEHREDKLYLQREAYKNMRFNIDKILTIGESNELLRTKENERKPVKKPSQKSRLL